MAGKSDAYVRASAEIQKVAMESVREGATIRDSAFSELFGYIRALHDHSLVTYEEGLSLRDELSLAFGGCSIRNSIEKGREYQERGSHENGELG